MSLYFVKQTNKYSYYKIKEMLEETKLFGSGCIMTK